MINIRKGATKPCGTEMVNTTKSCGATMVDTPLSTKDRPCLTSHLSFLIFLLLSFQLSAQVNTMPTTTDAAFDQMLQPLLSHTVPEMGVSACDSLTHAIYLDARAKHEYDVSHIEGAKWVGFTAFQSQKVEGIDKNTPIIVYCSVGYRSEKVAEKLISMGYKRVYNLYGGIFVWKNQGKPVVNAQEKPTEQVHTYNEEWGKWLFKGEKIH